MPDETTPPGDPAENDNQQPANTNGQDELGEAGQRAIAAERAARKAAEKRLGDLEKELNSLRESSMSEQEKAVERARREAAAEAQKGFNLRLKQAEVRAAAAGKLADPEDAIRFLDLDLFDVFEDGSVDKKAVEKALGDLVKAKPYLAASATRPAGDIDQGARGTPAGSSMNDLLRRAAGR